MRLNFRKHSSPYPNPPHRAVALYPIFLLYFRRGCRGRVWRSLVVSPVTAVVQAVLPDRVTVWAVRCEEPVTHQELVWQTSAGSCSFVHQSGTHAGRSQGNVETWSVNSHISTRSLALYPYQFVCDCSGIWTRVHKISTQARYQLSYSFVA